MTNGNNINYLIIDTINDMCTDNEVKKLIKSALRYELDIYNRSPRKSDIEGHYQLLVEKIIKERD